MQRLAFDRLKFCLREINPNQRRKIPLSNNSSTNVKQINQVLSYFFRLLRINVKKMNLYQY